jgi:N-acetyl-gamma-glutamyl-phosphate reductase
VQARLSRAMSGEEVRAALSRFYAGAPFVDILAEPPRLQDVVGTNRCRLGVAVDGDHLVVFSAIDNLVNGAAGGGIQWMNRLMGFPEKAGLSVPGVGWL